MGSNWGLYAILALPVVAALAWWVALQVGKSQGKAIGRRQTLEEEVRRGKRIIDHQRDISARELNLSQREDAVKRREADVELEERLYDGQTLTEMEEERIAQIKAKRHQTIRDRPGGS